MKQWEKCVLGMAQENIITQSSITFNTILQYHVKKKKN